MNTRTHRTGLSIVALRSISLAVTLLLVGFSSAASAYDNKTYFGISGGFARVLEEPRDSEFRLADDTSEAYEILVGWDITQRWSLEMSWSDLGDFKYEEISQNGEGQVINVDSATLRSFRFNALFYLFGTGGFEGIGERRGLNGFLSFGGALIVDNNYFFFSGVTDDLEGTKFNFGLGLEYGFSDATVIRGRINMYRDEIAFASLSIMWRFGRARGASRGY